MRSSEARMNYESGNRKVEARSDLENRGKDEPRALELHILFEFQVQY
jgi:hypothetical protein